MTASFLFPSEWPLWARRVFVLTLPISGPSLAVVWMLFGAVFGAVCAAVVICIVLTWVITPIAVPIIWLWGACGDLWFQSATPDALNGDRKP